MHPIEGGKGISKHNVLNSGEHLTAYRPQRKIHGQNVRMLSKHQRRLPMQPNVLIMEM